MPRPKRPRFIESKPAIQGFTPDGIEHTGETILSIEEFEAIRLSDYLGLDQSQAAVQMNVSRQTFGRILKRARFILSQALVSGKRLHIIGGSYKIQEGHRARRGRSRSSKAQITDKQTSYDENRTFGQGQRRGQGKGQGYGRGNKN